MLNQVIRYLIKFYQSGLTRPQVKYCVKSIGPRGHLVIKVIGTNEILNLSAVDIIRGQLALAHFDHEDICYIYAVAHLEKKNVNAENIPMKNHRNLNITL